MLFGESTVDCFDVCDACRLVCLSQGAAAYLVYVVQYLTDLCSLLFQDVNTIFVIIPLAVFAVFDPCLPISWVFIPGGVPGGSPGLGSRGSLFSSK